jgi:hypothetical protein
LGFIRKLLALMKWNLSAGVSRGPDGQGASLNKNLGSV